MTTVDALCTLIAVILAIQSVFVARFFLVLSRRHPGGESAHQPKAVIILCLRGSDPFLRDCITSLLSQAYADYQLFVVIDSDEDPAWPLLREFAGHEKLNVQVLRAPIETCSLKCSSLIQAINSLDESVEIIALCDADTVPHKTWLADLALPLANADVGVTTGGRWYVPHRNCPGSIVRYLWNIAVSVNMVSLKIAWGGSLAIRRDAIAKVGLLDKWSLALCEDTMLYRELKEHGLRQVFVPHVMMVNKESSKMSDFLTWAPRQMLTAKLYHPSWHATVGYAVISVAVPLLSSLMILHACITADLDQAFKVILAMIVFETSTFLLAGLCEWAVRLQLTSRGGGSDRFGRGTTLRLPFWILVSQLIAPILYWRCYLLCQVKWRGITYSVSGRTIERHAYSVYRPETEGERSL